jgi:hypothetical protein
MGICKNSTPAPLPWHKFVVQWMCERSNGTGSMAF